MAAPQVVAEANVPAVLSSASPASGELASAHAQLLLIGEAIRTAMSDLAISPSSTVAQTVSVQAPAKSKTSNPAALSLSTSASAALNGPPASTVDAAARPVMISATDRLAALYDHLRRVQALMKEYETVAQRAVELHLQPTPAEERGSNPEGLVEEERNQKAATSHPQPSQPGAKKISGKTGVSNNAHLNPKEAAPDANKEPRVPTLSLTQSRDTVGPSLHQRRALASDAAFSRFCGLRVASKNLLLPWTAPTTTDASTMAAAAGGAFRPSHNKGELNLDVFNARFTSASSSTSQCSSSGNIHSQASTALRVAEEQRQQVGATAHLAAYAGFFLHPQSSVKLTPTVAGKNKAAAVEEFLSSPEASADMVNGPGVLLRLLHDAESQFEALRRCRLFSYESQLRELKATAAQAAEHNGSAEADKKTISPATAKQASFASVEEPKYEHTTLLVDRMREVLTELRARFLCESHYTFCGAPAATLGRQLHAWTQPLLRQLNELFSNPTLEDVDQDLREKLRRMKFDVEELQQAQADAITNGDMQRSEELYYEQTAVSEALKEPYDEMEQLLEEYLNECVTVPRAALQEQKEAVLSRLTRAIEEHTAQLSDVAQDIDRVKEKRRAVIQSRHRQRNAMSAYQHSWKKQWQGNSDQQLACYRAMEQLEKRLSNLQKAQSVLVDDWLAHMVLERQREEDAAAFTCFAEARTQALTEAQRNLQSVVEGLRQFSGAIHFSCSHAEAFARDVLQGHVNEVQLALRKDRLAQFRALYLTLGDWRFKKSRNADEIQKKIEYYTLQQEVAMDALNPKAKEYSQAKQQWEAAKAEALAQLEQLDNRSRLQLEAFKPTEQRLREAGVEFTSPEDELAERNLQRTQRLVEYRQLIEEGIGVRGSGSKTNSGATATTQRLPVLKSSTATTPERPFTADTHFPSPPSSLRLNNNTVDFRKTMPLTGAAAATATAAAMAAVLSSVEETGDGNGFRSPLPPISNKSPTVPHLHSTEERIMRDITKSALSNGQSGSGKSQKRKAN